MYNDNIWGVNTFIVLESRSSLQVLVVNKLAEDILNDLILNAVVIGGKLQSIYPAAWIVSLENLNCCIQKRKMASGSNFMNTHIVMSL